jgi:RNA polymerase sigma factor (sigma-70 family)
MRRIKNQKLAQLLMQLRFSPQKKRKKQLDSAEKILALIKPETEYPFEFVCFRITGFHPKEPVAEQLIKGDELADDLRIFISKLSTQVAEPAAEQKEKVYSTETLAAAFDVSTKTIHRWRQRGLTARKFIFDDGAKLYGFLQSSVDRFVKKNPKVVSKAKTFGQLTSQQKQWIIKQATLLTAKTTLSRYQIIDQIAAKIGRVHETIRYTIANYEKANPDKSISRHPPGAISGEKAAQLYKMFRQGDGIEELMANFGRSKSSIYRIINRQRSRKLLAKRIEFVASDEFLQEGADKIITEPISSPEPILVKGAEPFELSGDSIPQYLQTLKAKPVLNRQREVQLFRRYNYLKYLASITRAEIKPVGARSAVLMKIESCLAEAEKIKKMIIEANLRLVVSIANKHITSSINLPDLVSEGNFALMRAVEKFDYTRGIRFATYGSWVISKDYARKIPAAAARLDRAPAASLANVGRDLRAKPAIDVVAVEQAHQSLVQVIRNNLDQREQYVILNHFGLLGSLVKKEKKTLQQIGQDLNISKERVRQIELTALQKLRQSLSIKEFELLTGR